MYTPTSSHHLFLSEVRQQNSVDLDYIGNQDLKIKEYNEKALVNINKWTRKLKHIFISILQKKHGK